MTNVYTIKIEKRRRVPLHGEKDFSRGFTTEFLGLEDHRVEVHVDMEKVANMIGERAVRSAKGKATALGGAVVVFKRS